jgi:hypothetical protein
MKRVLGLALPGLALALLMAGPAPAGGPASGNWRLSTLALSGNQENTNWILKLDNRDGKLKGTLVAFNPDYKGAGLVYIGATGETIVVVVKTSAGEQTFEGRLSKDGKKIVGVLTSDSRTSPAYMAPTEFKELEPTDIVTKLGINEMDQATDALRTNPAEAFKLYRQVLEKHPNTFAASRAAVLLLQRPQAEATPEEMRAWAEMAKKSAADFGTAWSADVLADVATALLTRKQTALALAYAQQAEKTLDSKSAVGLQMKVLQALANILGAAGQTAEQKQVAARLAKLEQALDAEYLAKVPPFKGTPFAGRKGKSDRVVVLEMFTGAECPPCVAADVAFDVLHKTYKATDLVLLQHHLHIPGPDPMTNADTEARAKYYQIGGTPTAFVNGVKKSVGGGGMAAGENKYNEYRGIIDPLLETDAACKLTASAKRTNSKIRIQADVAGLQNAGKNMKIRLFLVEETVRYVGGNKLRLHHHVVRAMPGGVDGEAVINANHTVKHEMDVDELRQTLTTYLENYAAKRPFPRADRPMNLQALRVIALVQDDSTQEILQAVQCDVVE